jgi:hypothetical protein
LSPPSAARVWLLLQQPDMCVKFLALEREGDARGTKPTTRADVWLIFASCLYLDTVNFVDDFFRFAFAGKQS